MFIYIYIYIPDIGVAVRVFTNGPGDLGSIPGRVIPKTQKMVLDASLLNTQHYKVRIKGKVEQSREGVAPSPTPWCSSYRKGSLRVTLDYGRQLYFFTYIYIYIYVCVCVCVCVCCCCCCCFSAFFYLSMFDSIIKTHFFYIILLRSFQVSWWWKMQRILLKTDSILGF